MHGGIPALALRPVKLSDFDYDLPPERIARQPAPRGTARMLVLNDEIQDRHVRDLPAFVRPGDVWVVNDTRVIPARIVGHKPSGGRVEVLLIEPVKAADLWRAWGRANKPIREGTRIWVAGDFEIEVLERDGRDLIVRLRTSDPMAAIEAHGHVPLPPYIDRPDTPEDRERYQTVFARKPGAVAAPTAGLHLTGELMKAMREAGASFVHLTLHVGPGTFQPVQVEDVRRHRMHAERFEIPASTAEAVNRARKEGRRVVAVGTTSLRALEAAGASGRLKAGAGRTSIFIRPGYDFRIVDALFTNFHLPRSTLLMLVAAFAGRERVLAAYRHAIEAGYRFYSYGDAMFLPERRP